MGLALNNRGHKSSYTTRFSGVGVPGIVRAVVMGPVYLCVVIPRPTSLHVSNFITWLNEHVFVPYVRTIDAVLTC